MAQIANAFMMHPHSVFAVPLIAGYLLLQAAGGSCENSGIKNSNMDQRQEQPVASPTPRGLRDSQWGGEGISMQIGSDSAAIVFNCANAEIKSVPAPDSQGRFTAEGTFTTRRPGPDREDDPPKPVPATFTGRISGDQMTLHVDLKSGESIGDFALGRDKTGPMRRCL